jgi:hypothetical protein
MRVCCEMAPNSCCSAWWGYQKPDVMPRRPEGVWDAYVRMHGVHAFYDAVRSEAFIHLALRQQPYGDWEFEVRDPNGYILVFSG